MIPTGTQTFCYLHQQGRMFCGCTWLGPDLSLANATFRVVLYLDRDDLRTQLRDVEETPRELPVEIQAGDIRPSKAIGVDRDAWVRMVATRHVDVHSTVARIRDWRTALAELRGAR